MGERGVFRVADSFCFAAQIPDKTVGISGSRCSHCGTEAAYCFQVCRQCHLPFVGPGGFPELSTWETLSLGEKQARTYEVFVSTKHGRVGYAGVHEIPLSPLEARSLRRMTRDEEWLFAEVHKITFEEFLRKAVGESA